MEKRPRSSRRDEPGQQEDGARGPLRSVPESPKGYMGGRPGVGVLCLTEARQGAGDRVQCEGLRPDNRADLALRSGRFPFQMSCSGLGRALLWPRVVGALSPE